MVAHYPQKLPSVRCRDNTGSILSKNHATIRKAGALLVAYFPQMPPTSVKNGDNTGSTLSANAALRKVGGITGSTFCANAAIHKIGAILVAHYPQLPPSVKSGDSAGSTLSANAYYIAQVCATL